MCHSATRTGTSPLLAEQFRSLASQVPTMYMVLVTNAVFMQFVIAPEPWDPHAYRASMVLAAFSVWRIAGWRRLAGSAVLPAEVAMLRTLRSTTAMACLVAIGLAGWSIHVLLTADRLHQTYVPLFAALSTITCAVCLTGLPIAAYCVIAAGTLPIAIALLALGDADLATTGANLMVITALVVGLIRRQYLQLRRMVASHEETQKEKHKVAELAFTDQLSGLPNRRAFLDALGEAAADGGTDVAVAMLDLDGFKAINDTFGHATGDGVLKAVGDRLQALLRPGDMLARLGGDEFAVMLRGATTLEAARSRLLPVAEAFEAPFEVDGKALKIGTSIGVAQASARPCPTMELIYRADLALYESKNSHERIRGFEKEMEERVRRRVTIEQAASDETALARLSLRFQPIFHAGTMRIDGFEALARWRHPTLGDIPPSEFIAVAERRGMTHALTAVLLRQAIEAASRWPEEIGLSFNLSANDLGSAAVCDLIASICAERGFRPERLSMEITETALLKDLRTARSVIDRLRAMGIKVLLDDFGAGFASIGYLRQMRFDGIKLDGSLIDGITRDAVARDLLVGVLQLCRAISCPVTAEMVETADHLRLLEGMGVDRLQGYHFGLPMTGEAVASLLAAAPSADAGGRERGARAAA